MKRTTKLMVSELGGLNGTKWTFKTTDAQAAIAQFVVKQFGPDATPAILFDRNGMYRVAPVINGQQGEPFCLTEM